jgi:glycerol-3-phosphate dehydrogenase
MNSEVHDVCVIGAGGVIGCAIARELAGAGWSVIGLERHAGPAHETSGRNSRVIHSGFHETPGTLKANLACAGSRLALDYARQKGIGLLDTGMLIAVPHGAIGQGLWRDFYGLWNVWRGGRAQSIPFKFLSGSGIRELAPIKAVGGIFIPSVGVIDLEGFVAALEKDAVAAGARFLYSHNVQRVEVDRYSYVITTPSAAVRARIVINSAGLNANEISRMAGGPQYPVEFIRGEYYEIVGGTAKWNIHRLIYPAMPPRSPSKGIHLGPRVDGGLFIGPNAYSVQSRNNYEAQITDRTVFLDAARRFLPDIRDTDLRWAYAGIRPRLATVNGTSDFHIDIDRTDPPLINLIGIDSPGLSASLAIGRHVRGLAEQLTRLRHRSA